MDGMMKVSDSRTGDFPILLRPLSDQILVRCMPDDQRMTGASRILLPPNADRGYLNIRTGIVMALGCGDAVAVECLACAGRTELPVSDRCHLCKGSGFQAQTARTAFTVQPGDRVLYHPRDWAHWEFQGEKYIVLHEDQGILGILDDDTVVFTENESTKNKSAEFNSGTRITNFSRGAA
jgi:co-chaperonin GroES (HSP10)